MNKLLLSLILILVMIQMPALAIDLGYSQLELEVQSIRNSSQNHIDILAADEGFDDDFEFGFEQENIYDYDYKSPQKAFIYSLLIPGWGQRYCGSHIMKTMGFLGTEIGMWMGYFNFHNNGNKLTDDFEAFADDHWVEGDSTVSESYRGWLYAVDSTEDEFTHTLPDFNNQQYYEMIGKYDQFRTGWDDYWLDPDYYEIVDSATGGKVYLSPNRAKYEDMRKDANDELDKANKFIIGSVLVHLVSAFDAAISAKRHNRNEASKMWLSVKAEMKRYSAKEIIPVFTIACRF
nr:hypothetical protein [candidate division Zixibacteria bacterium]